MAKPGRVGLFGSIWVPWTPNNLILFTLKENNFQLFFLGQTKHIVKPRHCYTYALLSRRHNIIFSACLRLCKNLFITLVSQTARDRKFNIQLEKKDVCNKIRVTRDLCKVSKKLCNILIRDNRPRAVVGNLNLIALKNAVSKQIRKILGFFSRKITSGL